MLPPGPRIAELPSIPEKIVFVANRFGAGNVVRAAALTLDGGVMIAQRALVF